MKHLLALCTFVCFLLVCGCTKPAHIRAGGYYGDFGPLVSETRLTDTISKSFTDTLHLEGVTGRSFRYLSGAQASYFAYQADPTYVLDALGRLPFPLRDHTADVGYHEMNTEEWLALRRTVGPDEISGAAFFWDVDPEAFIIYACVKKEYHVVLVDKMHPRIFHRIASRA